MVLADQPECKMIVLINAIQVFYEVLGNVIDGFLNRFFTQFAWRHFLPSGRLISTHLKHSSMKTQYIYKVRQQKHILRNNVFLAVIGKGDPSVN